MRRQPFKTVILRLEDVLVGGAGRAAKKSPTLGGLGASAPTASLRPACTPQPIGACRGTSYTGEPEDTKHATWRATLMPAAVGRLALSAPIALADAVHCRGSAGRAPW